MFDALGELGLAFASARTDAVRTTRVVVVGIGLGTGEKDVMWLT